MSWRRDRGRSPAWDRREDKRRFDSPPRDNRDRHRREREERRDRYDREPDRYDREPDRYDREPDRHRRERRADPRERSADHKRSPRRYEDALTAPSPPRISDDRDPYPDDRPPEREEPPAAAAGPAAGHPAGHSQVSPGDWYCRNCGCYNFKRRQQCYRRNCQGDRSEGIVYGEESGGITKRLLFRRLDALTTEEKILDTLKEVCSQSVANSIASITVGRESLTGASKCLAYVNFNSLAESTAAYTEIVNLRSPLKIDEKEVWVTYYAEPIKTYKNYNPDPSNYYSNAPNAHSTRNLSEVDKVNAAAAVAQSAISAAQARQMTWGAAASTSTTTKKLPTGDGSTLFTPPDVRTFQYDETSGYYYDPATGLYYDATTQYFFNNQTNQYMYWDATTKTYNKAPQATEQVTPQVEQPVVQTVKEPEEKKKRDKEDKVKVAKKIAKDMERWARTLNQKKDNAKSNIVMEQVLDTGASKGSADIGFSVLGAGPSIPTPQILALPDMSPPEEPEEFLVKKVEATDEEGVIDWDKLTCLLCKRKFPSAEVLTKHKNLSDLHKQNLAEYRKANDAAPQMNGYRDRAAERRMKFGEDETPIKTKRFERPEPPPILLQAPPPNVVDTIGGKMLQKMGWSEGKGLGKTEQGRIAPIEAAQRPGLAGLGQKKGIYTPTPGESYRDTVKKLMIARYKEVVGQDDEDE